MPSRLTRRAGSVRRTLACATWLLALGVAPAASAQDRRFDDEHTALTSAQMSGDGPSIVSAARVLGARARLESNLDAWLAIARASETLEAHGDTSGALGLARALIGRTVLFREPAEIAAGSAALQRVRVVAARIEASRGHRARAIALAQEVARLEQDVDAHEVLIAALRVLVRAGYANGPSDVGRLALFRMVGVAPGDEADLGGIEIAIAAGDLGAADVASDVLGRRLPPVVDPARMRLTELRLRISSAYAALGDARGSERGLHAIRADEALLGEPLAEPAATIMTRPLFARFDPIIDWTTVPLRCDVRGGVSRGAIEQLENRLAEAMQLRASIDRFGVDPLSLRAALREAAVHEAAENALRSAPARCAEESLDRERREIDRQAAALDRLASRIEPRDPRRADALRIESLLLRERADTSTASPDASTGSVEVESLAALEANRAVESVRSAEARAGQNAPLDMRTRRDDPEITPRMAEFVSRAMRRAHGEM